MFGNRDIPFHGDYNWISLANTDPNDPNSPLLAYMSWTDNRDVVPGTDPREIEEQNGFDDGFDVLQCRVDLAENTQSRDDGSPAATRPIRVTTVATAAASTRTSTAALCSSLSIRFNAKTGALEIVRGASFGASAGIAFLPGGSANP